MSHTISHFYRFGEFALDADQRVLLKGDRPVPLRPKVFDTLLVLVERSGRIVGKEELMTQIWPDSFVEEDNLTFNIRQLRKALGDDARWPRYVETVSRRGYRFIADVEEVLADTHTERRKLRIEPAALPPDYPSEVEPAVVAATPLASNNNRYLALAA
ncbi:MAG TPA: transcriptional regulator, partial [Pyrinomonadaceae bacterium]